MSNTEPTLIALLRANGYSVKNPCVDIQGVNFHCSLVRMHTFVDAPSGGDSITVFASSPNAWDMIGGTKMISKELGEKFVQRVHGLAPPMTMMDLCIERPGCWSRAIQAGFSHPGGEHVVSINKHYFTEILEDTTKLSLPGKGSRRGKLLPM